MVDEAGVSVDEVMVGVKVEVKAEEMVVGVEEDEVVEEMAVEMVEAVVGEEEGKVEVGVIAAVEQDVVATDHFFHLYLCMTKYSLNIPLHHFLFVSSIHHVILGWSLMKLLLS